MRQLLAEGEAWLAAERGGAAASSARRTRAEPGRDAGWRPRRARRAAARRSARRREAMPRRRPTRPPYNRGPMPRYGPPDAFETPRFSGPRTFMRLPHVRDLEDVDVAIVGIPTDGAVVYRSGRPLRSRGHPQRVGHAAQLQPAAGRRRRREALARRLRRRADGARARPRTRSSARPPRSRRSRVRA